MSEQVQESSLSQGRFCWRETGEGSPLILLHGWSMSHAVFHELADLLATDYHLLIPDLPGHGGSAPLEQYSLKSLAQLLDEWLQHLGLSEVNLLGWSLGGQVAQQFAADFSSGVNRLLLMSSTPRFCCGEGWTAGLSPTELRVLRRGLQKRYLATMGDFFDLQFAGEELTPERRRQILQFAVRPVGLPEASDALATLDILAQEDLRPILGEIESQTCIVHGKIDQIIPVAAGNYLSESIKNSTFINLPDVGHAPFLSRPEYLARIIREFCG